MTTLPSTGYVWPTAEQELILRAALMQGPRSLEAWQTWAAHSDIETVDPSLHRLLPLLYLNLKNQGVQHPLMARYKSVYRHTWYRNQLMLNRAAGVLRQFQAANISTMVLKGASLTRYYKDSGARPMLDMDILVPFDKALQAVSLLENAHWKREPYPPLPLSEALLYAYHASGFKGENGLDLDLHWHVLHTALSHDADAPFWKDSQPITLLDGLTVQSLDPADQLLHVCLHGLRWNPIPPVRWVADSIVILRTTPDINWERLIARAEQHVGVITLRAALDYLRRKHEAPIPDWVMHRLDSMPIHRTEQVEFEAQTKPWALLGPGYMGWHYVSSYRRWARGTKQSNILVFFKDLFGARNAIEFIWIIFRSGLYRLWLMLEWYGNAIKHRLRPQSDTAV